MIRSLLLILLSFNLANGFSQENNQFKLLFQSLSSNNSVINDSTFYAITTKDSIQFSTLKFYVSSLEFYHNNQFVWKESNSFHLIDLLQPENNLISLNIPYGLVFNQLKFTLGIDSTTSVSGAMGGALDPTKGMYWTWQSGYINFKIEGKCSQSPAPKNDFTFHLGGYLYPFSTAQKISFPVKNDVATIQFDLLKFTSQIPFNNINHIMSPGEKSVLLSKLAASYFSVIP